MSLNNSTLPLNAVWTPSGGTTLTFVSDGSAVNSGTTKLVCSSDTNLITRRTIAATVVTPALPAATGQYPKKGRTKMQFTLPRVLTSGLLVPDTATVELTFTHETPATGAGSLAELRSMVAAMILDSEYDAFWASQIRS